MADQAITDYDEKTTVDGAELIEVVDLKESAAADQNKKMTLATIYNGLILYDSELVTHNGNLVYG